MTYIVLRLVAVAGACLWLASGEQIAHATATSANVDSTRLVRLGGTRYRYVEGSLNGTIARDDGSTGSYSVGFVQAQRCWLEAGACFQQAARLWADVPPNGPLTESHRRLLERLCLQSQEQAEFYAYSSIRERKSAAAS
jgi:hypothetical protein